MELIFIDKFFKKKEILLLTEFNVIFCQFFTNLSLFIHLATLFFSLTLNIFNFI